MEKQKVGFKFGKYRLNVLERLGSIKHNGRTYSLVKVETNDKQVYLSLRLYNATGKFIKQLLFEPELALPISKLLKKGLDKVSKV